MVAQKIKNNASIAYFFLGWLFLLAKNNPNFEDPFIRNHAKAATKGHIIFFVAYFFYSYFLSRFLSYPIPVIQITIDRCVDFGFFTAITLFILRGAYNAQKEKEEKSSPDEKHFGQKGQTFNYEGATEAQRIKLLLSYIPFLGIVIAKRFPNVVTVTGARLSSVFIFFYLLISTSLGAVNSLSMILLFLGILCIVFLGVRFFTNDDCRIPGFLEKIPGMDGSYRLFRTLPRYIYDIFLMVFGKKESIDLQGLLDKTAESDRKYVDFMTEYFTDDSLPIPPYWIFVPFFNIFFLPRMFINRKSKYAVALGQGMVITLLSVLIGFISKDFSSPYELFLLFPIFYGIASVQSDPFTKIPIVYEFYVIINTLTFGLLRNTKKIREVQQKETSVRLKV